MNKSINCVEGCSLPSTPNDIKIFLKQLKREVEQLIKETEAKLLCHDRKNSRIMQIHKR